MLTVYGIVFISDEIPSEYIKPLDSIEISKLLDLQKPTVSCFARYPVRIKKRSFNYLSHTMSIALFYGIPVVQLVVIYQRVSIS